MLECKLTVCYCIFSYIYILIKKKIDLLMLTVVMCSLFSKKFKLLLHDSVSKLTSQGMLHFLCLTEIILSFVILCEVKPKKGKYVVYSHNSFQIICVNYICVGLVSHYILLFFSFFKFYCFYFSMQFLDFLKKFFKREKNQNVLEY